MIKQAISKKSVRIALTFAFCAFAVILFMMFSGVKAEAKTFVIKTPKQMRNINWKNKGFGPGTYKLGNDMTLTDDLGSDEHPTVLLTKGKFVIDFNGHTLQNSGEQYPVFSLRGANVTFKDSKPKNNISVRSYGAGAIDMTKGSVLIKNGYYMGRSDGTNNPVGLYVGGGKCVVNGGTFDGEFVGASTAGGKLYINNGTFTTPYFFALMRFGGGTIKISKGTFINSKSSYSSPSMALGSYNNTGNTYSFSSWLAAGASFSPSVQTIYWNGTNTAPSYYPTNNVGTNNIGYYSQPYLYAGSYTGGNVYGPTSVKVTGSPNPPKTKITKLSARSKALAVKWKKKSSKTTGYQIQYSTSSKFKKAKILTVKGKKKSSARISKLKGGKKYYLRVRTYRKFNGTKFYSKWSKKKSKKTN
ncbi:MAG: fibronectin type III domain-containing protein [Ruminococcus sp.]|nr:fibronectin type III domain-containing protein [Ruminococcus sp.]